MSTKTGNRIYRERNRKREGGRERGREGEREGAAGASTILRMYEK